MLNVFIWAKQQPCCNLYWKSKHITSHSNSSVCILHFQTKYHTVPDVKSFEW